MTPYLEGRDAFLTGEALSQCPYDRNTHSLSFRLWRNGWVDAERAASEALSRDENRKRYLREQAQG